VSQYPSDAKEPEQMLEHAAIAVKRAKELGRNQAQFYTEELQKRHEQRLVLETELRKSVDQRHFTLLYQPIVHLSTGRIAGVEALLRWSHPSYGVLTPDYFLEVADEIGLMNPIGKLVIAQAAQQLNDWARQGLDMFVTVNLSTRQFLQADLVDTIRRALEATGAPPHNFVVEIPESVQMLDPQRVQAILLALRQAGIRVALDRFGSGFSSLERLHAELITLLKIDRKFLFHAASNAAALNVTVAALGLARSLRLRPVAVGVENETQLSLCRQLECEYVQGNLVYVPTEAAQISEMARAGRLLR
jgi:EAL domain-containing protein (putative c-di-GMP-specific phosphodiesterase class I)